MSGPHELSNEPGEQARRVAARLQERGHHEQAGRIHAALQHNLAGAALLHALREACQVVLTTIEAIDPVSAGMVEELRLEVDKRLAQPHPG